VAAPWIIWVRRRALLTARPVATWVGPLIIAAGWASLVYGYDIHDNEFWFFGAILIAIGCILSFFGAQVMWRLLPAFIVLGFIIPVPGFVRMHTSMPLQTVMASLTQQVGEVMGIIISRSGNVLTVNDQQIEVAEACNGMRMVFGLFMVAYTFAFVTPLTWWARGLVLASAPLLALGCNLIRMVPTVWLYGYASLDTAETFHDVAGWAIIPLGFFLLTGAMNLLEWVGIAVMQPIDRPRKADEVLLPLLEQPA